MTSLVAALSRLAGQAFAAEGLSEDFGQVQVSDRPDLAQFQCNGALVAAKAARANPRAVAEKIAARLKAEAIFSQVEIAGPGFINLSLTDAALDGHVGALAADPLLGAPETGSGRTVVIDFGGPNIAKPMHVGHLRSSIIGDCLQRLYRANGWHVVSDVHLGDWGLQMGQLISQIELDGIAPIYFDANFAGPYPEQSPVSMDDLETLYPRASAACKADPARQEAARRATVDLQAGRPGYRALWRHFVKVSEMGLEREFGALGVKFDLWKGESSVDALIPQMLEDLKARGLAEMSEGALVVPVARGDDKKPLPPLILVKSEGGVLYGTTDLATIIERVREQDPDLILYVVDHRQHGHFEQVFRAAIKAGYQGRAELEHVGYGTMNGADGKPFKTRAGGVMKLHDLIGMATGEAARRLAEAGIGADYPEEERAEIARKVGIATIKFADLSNHRSTDYVFDLERFSRFEGKTGPYLQYAAVRIQSILRKARGQGDAPSVPAIHSPEERALVLQLLGIGAVMATAEAGRAPHLLCEYAFALAQNFSRFYGAHHILSESDAGLRASRLGLCALVLAAMTRVLDLLGIEIPERM
ncbi:MAG: arginine--tRNA ligase [Alphaproteobacteria bacterium 64-11]|nr:arginine--tRNA ligase [Alphaproteobacteria bacterium]OJU11953.1 MAG: arginine--tRNA ligase [Alphaproteobacteria bacterium 64-11]